MSTQKDYRRCLEQLAAAPPKRKAALVRSLLPGIEAALNSGQGLKDIWEALETEGLRVSYHTFQMAVWRARRKPIAKSGWGKQEKPSELQGVGEPGVEVVDERDPLANLRRLEDNRPGVHVGYVERANHFPNGKGPSRFGTHTAGKQR